MINTDSMRLPDERKLRYFEEKENPFSRRSKEFKPFPEDTRRQVGIKLNEVLMEYVGYQAFLSFFKSGAQLDKMEHGKQPIKQAASNYRTLNSDRYNSIIKQMRFLKDEMNRLQAILNA